MRRYVFALLAIATLGSVGSGVLGCEATIPEGRFACEADEDCPPGFVCRPERDRCYTTRTDADAG